MAKGGAKRTTKVCLLKEGKHVRFLEKNGWEYFERTNCSGVVVVLALTDQKKVLFIEQHRIPVARRVVEFPAGLINDKKTRKKESACQAAKRELLEETGYQAQKVIQVVKGSAGGGITTDILTFCMALGIKKVAEGGGDETEDILVHEVPIAKAEKWLARKRKEGCLTDPKIYAGLYFLNKYNEHSIR